MKNKEATFLDNKSLSISVGICAYNEEAYIKHFLRGKKSAGGKI